MDKYFYSNPRFDRIVFYFYRMNKIGKGSLIAILITLVIHVATLLYFNLSKLETREIFIPSTALLELDFKDPEIIEEEINPEEEIQTPENNQSLKDLMKDIQDIRKKSNKNFNESEIEQEILDKIQAENKANSTQKDNKPEGDFGTKKNTKTAEEKGTDKKIAKNAYAGNNVTVSCNVPGRTCHTKRPTYICKGGGKVYIEIKVDKIGRVKNAKVVSSKSTTTNECILNNALDYAKSTTKVSSDLNGNNSQTGYIIYNFIKQ